ncbi:ZN829 protein, partial [Urocolius indicus]|nr:ZN829 protein [Urocolius indicus]NXX87444.1 ZN829 protein [Urocolius indicus]
ETLRWSVIQDPEPPGAGRRAETTPGSSGLVDWPRKQQLLVLQKAFECGECGKSFSCSSHFNKHRRTHTG